MNVAACNDIKFHCIAVYIYSSYNKNYLEKDEEIFFRML